MRKTEELEVVVQKYKNSGATLGSLIKLDLTDIEKRVLAHALDLDPDTPDVYRAKAAQMFNVTLEGVTPDQRRAAKEWCLMSAYGAVYEYHCTTTLAVSPSTLNLSSRYGAHRAVTAGDVRVWSFESEAERNLFVVDHVHHVVRGD